MDTLLRRCGTGCGVGGRRLGGQDARLPVENAALARLRLA